MTSGRWDVGARTDRIFFASTRRITMNPFDTRAYADFRWVPSGEMAQWSLPSQCGRAPSKLLARESHALQRFDVGAFPGGPTKPLRRSFSNFSIDGRVSQKFISATPLGPICQACGSSRSRLQPREPKTSLAKFKQWH